MISFKVAALRGTRHERARAQLNSITALAVRVVVVDGVVSLCEGAQGLARTGGPLVVGLHTHHTDAGLALYWKKIQTYTGCLIKRNTFDLEYLKDGSIKLIVLLVCYS